MSMKHYYVCDFCGDSEEVQSLDNSFGGCHFAIPKMWTVFEGKFEGKDVCLECKSKILGLIIEEKHATG